MLKLAAAPVPPPHHGFLPPDTEQVAKAAQELGVSEDKSVLLQHMLLSHHGQPEFGAAVVPCCVVWQTCCMSRQACPSRLLMIR